MAKLLIIPGKNNVCIGLVIFSENVEVIAWNSSKLCTVLYNMSNNEIVVRVMDLEL